MKLNVGDYVRTKNGIAKIIDISCGEDLWLDNDNIFDEDEKEIFRYNKPSMYSNWADNNIIKSSPDIIDLVEAGDIVINKLGEIIRPTSGNIDELKDYWKICEKPINSIVTKEQFESMKYVVKED